MVVDLTQDTWSRALIRAKARGLDVTSRESFYERGRYVEQWAVSSHSNQGTFHSVRIVNGVSNVAAYCDCTAGQKGIAVAECISSSQHFRTT
jgi:hypothetical protein